MPRVGEMYDRMLLQYDDLYSTNSNVVFSLKPSFPAEEVPLTRLGQAHEGGKSNTRSEILSFLVFPPQKLYGPGHARSSSAR